MPLGTTPLPSALVRNILVTGGAGFIGSNLTLELQKRHPEARIVVIDDFRSGDFRNLEGFRGDFVTADVSRLDWAGQFKDLVFDGIFHEASITDTTVHDQALQSHDNIEGFRRLLEFAQPHQTPVVYASSAATYGICSGVQREEQPPAPANIYAFSKVQLDNLARDYARRYPAWRIVGLRYFNVYGPGERLKGKMASMAWQLGTRLLSGEKPRLFVDGSQARDQVHVDDVVECTLTAAGLGQRPDPAPGVYNAGSGVPTSFNEMLSILRRALEVPESVLPTEYFEMPDSVREFYQHWTCADMSATARGLGFVPKIPPADGLRRYAEFMRHSRAKRG